jgi:hypothetical protein
MESNPFEIIQFDHALDARQIPKSISGGPFVGYVAPRGEHFVSHSHKSSMQTFTLTFQESDSSKE